MRLCLRNGLCVGDVFAFGNGLRDGQRERQRMWLCIFDDVAFGLGQRDAITDS